MSRIDFTLIEFPVVSASDPVHGTATLPDAGSAAGGSGYAPSHPRPRFGSGVDRHVPDQFSSR